MKQAQFRKVIAILEAMEADLGTAIQATKDALALQGDLSKALSKPVQTPLKHSSNAAQHLRQHRPGRPSKIDSDPELRAFIVERLNTTTFTALERAVAKAFPADRRIGKSAIHQWWERNVKSIRKSDPE